LDSNINIDSEEGADLEADMELTVDASADAEAEVDAEEGNPDPMDPGFGDVDKIMKRYENNDFKKELATKKMSLGQDTKGGIDSIAASNSKHNQNIDDKYIKEIFDGYTTGDKDQNGAPNGNRVLTKWNAQLASEDVINNWNELSAGAVEKFFAENMDKSWKKFDMYDRGSIPDTEEVYFARDLMNSLAPPEKEDPYALDFSVKKVQQIDVDPLVEPDAPVMERPKDHTKTKPYKPTTGDAKTTAPAAQPKAPAASIPTAPAATTPAAPVSSTPAPAATTPAETAPAE
jgi:hypothetical protein